MVFCELQSKHVISEEEYYERDRCYEIHNCGQISYLYPVDLPQKCLKSLRPPYSTLFQFNLYFYFILLYLVLGQYLVTLR